VESFLVSIGWYNVAAGLALTATPYPLEDHGALWSWRE